ncbi:MULTISPECIES: TonB-dependent receptor [Brevundimonas]|uniref:TonB-dependent receptor n=1 Tax=Brevundimonas sp. 357 TaxID=2555782 RepID=UPI000F7A22A2|nr:MULTISPECIES: TonB-dependent receptor [Brevundimonas]RSB47716.1 TonB-dependent receptor [Brevundimonas sp. 357]
MLLRSGTLGSVSLLALAVAHPAWSQDFIEVTPPSAASDGPVQVQDVVVTGLRGSLRSAQALKRNADEVMDAIVAEDIGKLPDVNASESLARVTGIQVERGGGEASRVIVRGLPDVATTYNGRDIFTDQGRSVAMQDFPAAAIAALEVYKSSSAWRLESGIAGLINVRSRWPFDFDGFELSTSVKGSYATQSESYDPNGDILISNRWNTGAGEIGALLNLSYTSLRYLDSVRWDSGGIVAVDGQSADPAVQGARYPDAVGIFYGTGERWRPSANLALQWRPNDQWEFYIEALYQGYRNKISDRQFIVPLNHETTRFEDVALRDGRNEIQGLTQIAGRRPEQWQGASTGKTNTWQAAVGGSYNAGPLQIAFDLARTDSTYEFSNYSFDTAFTHAPVTLIDFDTPGEDGGAAFEFRDFDVTNPDNYVYRGLFDRHFIGAGDDWQAKIDLTYDTGNSLIPQLKFGVRYVDRNGSYQNGERYQNQEDLGLPLTALPVELALIPAGFNGSDVQAMRAWVSPTYGSLRSNMDALRALAGFEPGRPPINPVQTYEASETAYTAYGQADFAINTRIPIEGELGLRIVATDFTVRGTSRSTEGEAEVFTPVDQGGRYTDLLPSLGVRFMLDDGLILRMAANQTRTRPAFGQLNPSVFVSPSADTSGRRTASGGNPDLKPIQSTNYDLTLERYFADTGAATLALFRREISGFIADQTMDVDDPVYGVLRVTRPVNLNDAVLQGVEASFTTFFDYDFVPQWARSFGVQANATYIDGALPYVSKYSYNLTGMYENGPWTARLAYNLRTKFGNGVIGEHVDDVARLDFSAGWSPTERITVSFDATNILGQPFRSFYDYGEGVYPRDVRYEESLYTVGLRFRY